MIRYKFYSSLQSIIILSILFFCITIDFILCLSISSKEFDTAIAIVDKFIKYIDIISEITIWTIENWNIALIRYFQFADWRFSRQIISDCNRKFLFKFWRVIFCATEIDFFYSILYYLQINRQTERIIAAIEIVFRYFLTIYLSEK